MTVNRILAGNSFHVRDTSVTNAAHNLDFSGILPASIAFFVGGLIEAPSTNTDTIYFRINGPTATVANGLPLAPGESAAIETYFTSLSIIAGSGTQTVDVDGWG